MDYVIGIDGGGSSTSIKAYLVEDGRVGFCIGHAEVAGMNYNFDGVEAVVERLLAGVHAVTRAGRCLAIGIGDPSLDEELENVQTADFLATLLAAVEGVPIYIRSDVYMALYGFVGEGEGALVISGTGSIGTARDGSGLLHTVGGWGRLVGDEGSAYWIGLEGIRAAVRAHDGVDDSTVLTGLVKQEFGLGSMRDLINVLYGASAESVDVASFALVVDREAALGDAVSIAILEKAGDHLAGFALALVERLCEVNPDYEKRELGIYGSVLVKNTVVQERFCKLVRARYPELRVAEPVIEAEEAAAMYALQQYGRQGT